MAISGHRLPNFSQPTEVKLCPLSDRDPVSSEPIIRPAKPRDSKAITSLMHHGVSTQVRRIADMHGQQKLHAFGAQQIKRSDGDVPGRGTPPTDYRPVLVAQYWRWLS